MRQTGDDLLALANKMAQVDLAKSYRRPLVPN
jgi:hypothetical protein